MVTIRMAGEKPVFEESMKQIRPVDYAPVREIIRQAMRRIDREGAISLSEIGNALYEPHTSEQET